MISYLEEDKERALKVIEYAEKNPMDVTKGIPENFVPACEIPEHVAYVGYVKIVYSHELRINRSTGQKVRLAHISISCDDKCPSPGQIYHSCELFNIDTIELMWIEEGHAFNAVQVIK